MEGCSKGCDGHPCFCLVLAAVWDSAQVEPGLQLTYLRVWFYVDDTVAQMPTEVAPTFYRGMAACAGPVWHEAEAQ